MLKRGASIGLIILLIAQVVSNFSYVLNYHFNLEKYQESCINKSRPELNCNGSCSLSAQINLDEIDPLSRPENPNKQDKKNKLELNLFYKIQSGKMIVFRIKEIYPIQSIYKFNSSFFKDIFHPPQYVS